MAVSEAPNGMLMRTLALMAHPQASRIGPRLRRFNLNQASIIDGPETASIRPATARGTCHNLRLKMPLTTEARIPPMAPIAKPIAAKMPANLAISNAGLGTFGTVMAGLVTPSCTALTIFSCTVLALDAANFCICSLTSLDNFLYGDQNA